MLAFILLIICTIIFACFIVHIAYNHNIWSFRTVGLLLGIGILYAIMLTICHSFS